MIVTLDGPAAAGKGTISRLFAMKTKMVHVDVGLIFRSAAYAVQRGIVNKLSDVTALYQDKRLAYYWDDSAGSSVILDGEDVAKNLYRPEIASFASSLAACEANLTLLNELVREIVQDSPSAVCDGRHNGTGIFPEAEFKFFVTADVEVRASRRTKDLQARGHPAVYEDVLKDLRERDGRDFGRLFCPLKVPEGAVIIDTGMLSVDESVTLMCQTILGQQV